MKNIIATLTIVLTLASCREAYETLSTPFKHAGDGLGYIGSTVLGTPRATTGRSAPTQTAVGAYEVAVKAPPGSVVNTAVDLFHKEARKVCSGGAYKHKITHQGTTSHTEVARTSMDSLRVPETQMVPTVKGYVICNEALEV